jgi:hypothetical protein
MQFRGGGVGHKSTREATNYFLADRDLLDIPTLVPEEEPGDAGDNEIERCDGANDDEDIGGSGSGSEEIEDEGEDGDHVWVDIDEEEDFGYSRLTDDESDEGSDDELDVDDVHLSAEDGEDDTGFADL